MVYTNSLWCCVDGVYVLFMVSYISLAVIPHFSMTLKTTTHPKTRCRKPYAASQHLMLLMMGVYTRNISS